MEKGLLEKTGKSLEEWIVVVKASGLEKHGEIMKLLKEEHGMTHGYANFVTLKAREADAGSTDADTLIANQYEKKQDLKPIYDALIEKITQFGSDVEIAPKKANVSLRRKVQFALIQPSTRTRIDLGLKLKDKPTTDRLESSGPFGTMCTHRVQITDISQIDDELISWLTEAYEQAG